MADQFSGALLAPDWQAIVFGGETSYLTRIVGRRFRRRLSRPRRCIPGIRKGEPGSAREQMVAFVNALAAQRARLKPGFLVVPQNGEELLEMRATAPSIDAIAKEDLLFGDGRPKRPNKPAAHRRQSRTSQPPAPRSQAGVRGRIYRQSRGRRGRPQAHREPTASCRISPTASSTPCGPPTCRRQRNMHPLRTIARLRSSPRKRRTKNPTAMRSSRGGNDWSGRAAGVCCGAPKYAAAGFPTFRCGTPGRREISRLLKLLALPGGAVRLYPLNNSRSPWRSAARRRTRAFPETPASWRPITSRSTTSTT